MNYLQAAVCVLSDRELLDHWKQAIDELASEHQQKNYLVRKVYRGFTESQVYERATVAWGAWQEWRTAFSTFSERLALLEEQYRREHGSGLYRVKGAGKLKDLMYRMVGDQLVLNDEKVTDILIQPIMDTKFILDEILKDGRRSKVIEYAKEAGQWHDKGNVFREYLKPVPSIGRAISAVEKDLHQDGYTEADAVVGEMQATSTAFQKVKDLMQPLITTADDAMAVAGTYSTTLLALFEQG